MIIGHRGDERGMAITKLRPKYMDYDSEAPGYAWIGLGLDVSNFKTSRYYH